MRRHRNALAVFALFAFSIAIANAAAGLLRVQISSPRDNASVSEALTVSGTSSRSVVNVTGWRETKKVFSDTVQVRGGRWHLSKGVSPGPLEIRATDEDSEDIVNVLVVPDDRDEWGGGDQSGDLVRFDNPREGGVIAGRDVRFNGRAENGDVRLQVYRGGTRVYNGSLRVRNGSWSTTIRLENGSHTAQVQQGSRRDSVSFTIGTKPAPSGELRFDNPRDGGVIAGRDVRFNGRAENGDVRLQVYRGNVRVHNSSVRVRNGAWSTTVRLENGSHTATVQQGSRRDNVAFTIGTRPTPGDAVAISSPRNGATVGRRVSFGGTTSGESVGVQIMRGGAEVFNGSQRASNRRWSFERTLEPGSYRLTVTSGKASSSVSFRVR